MGGSVGQQPLQFKPADRQVWGAQVDGCRSREVVAGVQNVSLLLMTQTPGSGRAPRLGISPWRAGMMYAVWPSLATTSRELPRLSPSRESVAVSSERNPLGRRSRPTRGPVKHPQLRPDGWRDPRTGWLGRHPQRFVGEHAPVGGVPRVPGRCSALRDRCDVVAHRHVDRQRGAEGPGD
jgi:hypothetical protein